VVLPELLFDGNWVDVGSIITGMLYVPVMCYRRVTPIKLLSKGTGIDFANGMALFPLCIMAVSPLSSGLVKGLVEASKPSLAIAGVFALLAILEE
jgi:hypothetical protein